MKTLELSAAGNGVNRFVKNGTTEPWIITSNGKPVAALTHLREGDLEDFLLGTDPRFTGLLQRSRKQFKKSDCTPLEQLVRKPSVAVKRKGTVKPRRGNR